jgi:radical SAM superfamily enzyme YgiQ (UPF0313 family)
MNKQLDALFVNPNSSEKVYQALSKNFTAIEVPTWSLLLAQSCRSVGYGVAILDCDAERLTDEAAVKRIKEINPRLVVFCVYGQNPNSGTTNMSGATSCCELLKDAHPELKTCFVGSHTIALPKEVLSHKFVDFVLLNEGVYALRNLLMTDLENDLQMVKGIGWKDDGGLRINDPQSTVPLEKMDQDMPGSAWDLLPYKDKPLDMYRSHFWHANFDYAKRSPAAAIYTSLGCQFKCQFCLDGNTKIIISNTKNKKAKDVIVGDRLAAYDEKTGEVVETTVVKTASRTVDTMFKIILSDGKEIKATGEHPFYREGQWIVVADLKVGDNLLVIAPSDKISLQKKLDNPMKRQEVADKVGLYWSKRWENGYANHLCDKDWHKNRRCAWDDPAQRVVLSKMQSERMTLNNPMKNKVVANKVSCTAKANFAAGTLVPFMCTDVGKAVIGAKARERGLSSNNPMHKMENKQKASMRMRAEKNPSWQGGISKIFQQYPVEFSKSLKSRIKKRDAFICQECGEYGKGKRMPIHHIDYNKHNNVPCNLLTLCQSCHGKTNFNRDLYKEKYQTKMLQYTDCPHNVSIESIELLTGEFVVYNFECDQHNNYFAEYILTHNCMINSINRDTNDDNYVSSDTNKMRFWSPEFMIKEIDKLVEYGVSTIRLSDEMFVLNKKYYEPFLNLIVERGYGKFLNFWCYSRVDSVNPKFLDLFRQAGIKWFALGIESANQAVRKEITKGSFKDINIREIVQQIRDHDINVIANYIYGLDTDTHETMQQTLDLAIELNTEMYNGYPAQALPGSPLHRLARERGWQLPDDYIGYSFHSYECSPMRTEHLTAAEVVKFRDDAWLKYMTGDKYLNLVEKKFGLDAKNNILEMSKIKLKRKLLGD